MLDYHLHLWPHRDRASTPTLDQLAAYCEHAAAAGVQEIALTEHFHRFRQADALLSRWWEDDPDPGLCSSMASYWDWHVTADMDTYVGVVLEAKQAGLPVVLGMEVDYFEGRMDKVAALLDGYPFDVLLGSVHWLGSWGFDNFVDPAFASEWSTRSVEEVWDQYTRALEELAGTATCDVLAHPDLCKVAGHVPSIPDEFYDRMTEAAVSSGMAAEVSSAGWHKPIAEEYPAPALLARFHAAGVPITTASDGHELVRVADRSSDLRAVVAAAGYEELCAFRGRRPEAVPL